MMSWVLGFGYAIANKANATSLSENNENVDANDATFEIPSTVNGFSARFSPPKSFWHHHTPTKSSGRPTFSAILLLLAANRKHNRKAHEEEAQRKP